MNEKERIDVLRNYLIKKLNSLLKRLSYKKEEKDIIELFDKQKGKYNEKISKIIEGLKKPKYTKSLLDELKKQGYTFEFEDGKYYIIYDQNEPRMEMPKDIRELFEQLGLFEQIVLTKAIIENIMVQMVNYSHNDEIGKKELEEISETIQVEPYSIIVDSNGAIRLDVNGESSYLPIRFSRKMLSLGALPKEQELMKQINDSNDSLGKQINAVNASHSLYDVFELFEELKTFNDNSRISFIDGRYYIEDSEAGTSVELSLEQNNTITELENSIFSRIRDSYEKPDNNTKNIDFRSYDALLKLIELGFKIERDETSNKIIITSVTGREFTKEQSDFFDLDFSKLPFIKEKSKSKRSELTKENLERVLKLSRNIDTKTVELMQKLTDVKEMTNADVEAQTNYIKDVFLNRTCSIIAIDRKYYIIGQDFQIPLTDEQYEFLSKLEENLFNTIYNSEKDSDVDGEKSVVQDVNGYNTLIQMMGLGYIFNMITDEENNIVDDRVLITSPTGKVLIRSINDFENIKMGEIHWDVQKDNKTNYFKLQTLKNYKELAEYINNKIYPAIEAAEKNLDGNGDNLQIELSIKYLFEALNPNDGDKLTSYVNGVYVIVSKKNEIAISLDETLSEKIDRLTKEYIEVLYQNNKTTSKKPSNEQGNSKEDIIEDIRSYFADEGTEIEDIENKMSPVFDENGERISIDFNAQKTIIQLMELGYRFAVEEGTIKITSPCGNTFDASTEDFKQKGLPYTQSIFNLIQRFAKSEEKGKDYSTKNYYDFLYGLAEIEDKFKIIPKITKKRHRYLKEENQGLEERKREVSDYVNNIIRKIEEIKKLPLEEGHGQLISFYQQLKENKQFRMKLKCENSVDDEFGIYEIYDCTTDDLSTLSDQVLYTMSKEKSEDIGAIGGVLADYLLKANDTEQSEFRIETSQWNGIVQLLEIGFTLKSDKIDNQNVIRIYDPFGTYTKLYIPDKENNNVNRSPEETIKHFKELVMFAERINEQIVPLFENTDEDFKSVNCFELLRRTRELKNSNDISFDSVTSGRDDKKMYFINPQNGKKIPLSEKHAELLYEIRKVLGNDELYIRLQNIIEGKPIEDGMGIDNKLIVPNNETYEDKVFNSYRMYKQLRAFGLDMEAYEGGFKRLVLITPWNDKIGEIRPNSVSLLTENPISSELTKSNPTNKEIEMLHLLFSQGMQKTLDLFEECYDSGMNNKEEIMKFLIERAKTVYERKQVAENPIITVGKSAIFRAQQTINGIRSGWPNLPRRIGYIREKNQNPQGDKNHKRLRTGVSKDD